MKQRWKSFVKDYLTFTRRDRNGLYALLLIGTLFYFLPDLVSESKPKKASPSFSAELAQLKIYVDSARDFRKYATEDDHFDYYRPKQNAYERHPKGELFAFDPNTLDEEGWRRLGLRDKTIQTIQNFLAKGYKFRQADDIRKIYGLRPAEADRLVPYVQIASNSGHANDYKEALAFTSPSTEEKPKPTKYAPRVVDINTADTSGFISLPGIGSKLAARIVNFRDKLGGFVSVQQVAETYGVPDSTFQKIKPMLQCVDPRVKTININSSDVNQLRSHPYIKWNIANAIVNYRQQHGSYKSVTDLRKIDIIPEELFQKISPYLTL